MEIVDELLTPGCPNCAVKHLSAALAYLADSLPGNDGGVLEPNEGAVLGARAYVNLIESIEGYDSHFEFAIGLIQRAEEWYVRKNLPGIAFRLRGLRVKLITEGRNAAAAVADEMALGMCPYLFAAAHLSEAHRELSSFITCVPPFDTDVILKMIAEIRKEYFDFQPPTVGEEANSENGGESMACAKKAAPKAAKAACKGGKCAAPKKGCKK